MRPVRPFRIMRRPCRLHAISAVAGLARNSNSDGKVLANVHPEKQRPAAPPAPPLHNTNTPLPSAQPSSSLSPLAPTFVPPPPPPPRPPPSPPEDSAACPPDLRHLLPHAHLSYEELRWDYYRSHGGGPFPQHSSSKKRPEPPSPSWGSPTSAIVGCVVNERRTRASPPPPPTPPLPPERKR